MMITSLLALCHGMGRLYVGACLGRFRQPASRPVKPLVRLLERQGREAGRERWRNGEQLSAPFSFASFSSCFPSAPPSFPTCCWGFLWPRARRRKKTVDDVLGTAVPALPPPLPVPPLCSSLTMSSESALRRAANIAATFAPAAQLLAANQCAAFEQVPLGPCQRSAASRALHTRIQSDGLTHMHCDCVLAAAPPDEIFNTGIRFRADPDPRKVREAGGQNPAGTAAWDRRLHAFLCVPRAGSTMLLHCAGLTIAGLLLRFPVLCAPGELGCGRLPH
jgi:hypothetical protein